MNRLVRLGLIAATAALVPLAGMLVYFGTERAAVPSRIAPAAGGRADPPAALSTKTGDANPVAGRTSAGASGVPAAGAVTPDAARPAPAAAVAALSPTPVPPAPAASVPAIPLEVRNVTPPGVTPPPAVTGPLQRLPGREPIRKPLGPPKLRVLRPILVESAGVVRAGDVRVRLAGVAAPGAEETCRDGGGRDWPCGARAAVALRAFVRGRGLQCTVPEGAREGDFVSACRLGSEDVGRWLVRQGWAKAAGDDLGADETEARRAGLGLWATAAPTAAN